MANSPLGKTIIEEEIKQAPEIYDAGGKIIKNKKIKRVLEVELASYAVEKAQGQLCN